ncbi:MAG: hypothetical protein KAH31_08860 [Candidatus Sabulitectum sp.]|nr:hypothetical protein [Candidatus Sabulitectum sp.]
MVEAFFKKPILNSPYEYLSCQWELDEDGQPTQRILDERRPVVLITPIPKPQKRKRQKGQQQKMVFDEAKVLSTEKQQYANTSSINSIRRHLGKWRATGFLALTTTVHLVVGILRK